jgi:hypothetical protein
MAFVCEGKENVKEWETHLKTKGLEIEGRMDWERGVQEHLFQRCGRTFAGNHDQGSLVSALVDILQEVNTVVIII